MPRRPAVNEPTTRHRVSLLLQAQGVKPTRQRTDIALILLERPQHLSADQVLARVSARGGRVSKATVYNTLGLFAARGLVREVVVDPTRVFYDSNTAPHHHLYDVDTGLLQDIAITGVSVGELPELPPGAVVQGVEVIVRVRYGSGDRSPGPQT